MLTRAAGPHNLAVVAQFVPLLGEVEQKIIGCFRDGGGLPYSEFPRFHALMAETSGAVFDAALVDVVLPLVDGLTERLRSGVDVADFGCGSGHAINVMAQAFPASRFTGLDFSDEAVAAGVAEAARLGLTNASFDSHNLAELDMAAKKEIYDVITVFDAIHDQAQPARVLENIHRALRPGGVLSDGRHQGIEPARGQRRRSDEHLPLHDLDDALHDGVAGTTTAPGWERCGEPSWRRRCSPTPGSTTCGWPRSSRTRSTTTTSPESDPA